MLSDEVFGDRRRQFVTRHKWDLCVTQDGLEVDEYDQEDAQYIVVHDSDRHLTSCRLRPAGTKTMLLDHFSVIFPAARPFIEHQADRLYELTRFLKSPSMTVREGTGALMAFAEALDNFRDAQDAVGFVAVVYPSVSRFLRQSGVRFLVVDVSEIDGKRVELICLTQAVAAPGVRARQQAFVSRQVHRRPIAPINRCGALIAA